MEILFPRCAGLDVHKKTVVACVLVREGRETRKALHTFGTTTAELLALQTWLTEHQVTHVAMEATASYWKPVFNVLESSFTTWLVNPAHIKAVPGRKTDAKDAEWIAELLQHGLLKPSFIPDRAQRELRELTRYRKSLIEERAREINRIQKVLEGPTSSWGRCSAMSSANRDPAFSPPWRLGKPTRTSWRRWRTRGCKRRRRRCARPWRAWSERISRVSCGNSSVTCIS